MNNVLSSIDTKLIDKLVVNSDMEYIYSEDINTLILSTGEFDYNDKTVLY